MVSDQRRVDEAAARLAEARARAARDAEILGYADTVVSDMAAARTENHWADRVRELFRGN